MGRLVKKGDMVRMRRITESVKSEVSKCIESGIRIGRRVRDILMRGTGLEAAYTVEAAGVMAVVLFTVMILINQAFRIHAETTGYFALHEVVERERHAVENRDEAEIVRQAEGSHWSLEITAPVYRPENSLRLWSLAEDLT